MEFEKNIELIEQSRLQVHEMIDRRYDELINRLSKGDLESKEEAIRPLYSMPALFKGMKPKAVIFPDGREVEAKTWKKVVTEILKDCNQDKRCHEDLMKIRDKVAGRDRIILGSDAEQMDVPLQIDEKLFFEGKFDTESLLRVLCNRVLDVVGYDYRGICLNVYNPQMKNEQSETIQEENEEQTDGFVMQM